MAMHLNEAQVRIDRAEGDATKALLGQLDPMDALQGIVGLMQKATFHLRVVAGE
jgi:hypothetical protein